MTDLASTGLGLDVHAATGRDAVFQVCRDVMTFGKLVAPRGKLTREVLGCRIVLDDPTDTVPDGICREGLLPAIGLGEALQCVSGVSAPGLMADISRGFPRPTSRWAEDVPTYGARLSEDDQLGKCVRALNIDPESRQAVALIWRPYDMTLGQAHNLCTIGLQFLLRGGLLHMFVHMRSNDAWHGLPYDLFQFAQVQCSVANSLGVGVGPYVHTANSMHLYEPHWGRALDLEPAPDGWEHEAPVRPWGVGRFGEAWPAIQRRAARLLAGKLPSEPTVSEELYHNALLKYTDNKEETA